MIHHEPFMHPDYPHPPWNDQHPAEPHHHPHHHPWGDVLATGECDDQLPLFSHVGRGLKGDSFRVELREPTLYEAYLDGYTIDSNTGLETPAWTTANINGGLLESDKITDPDDLDDYGYPDGTLPENMYGYLLKYFRDSGTAPRWTEFIGPFPNDAVGYEMNIDVSNVDDEGNAATGSNFFIHAWTSKPDGTREYDPTYDDYYCDFWSPEISSSDTEALNQYPVYDVIIKNDGVDDTWEPNEITTETEWDDPTYDHSGTQRKNTYPDSWDPDKVSDLLAPGEPGIVTVEVGPGKDVNVYTTPQDASWTGYGPDSYDPEDLIPLPYGDTNDYDNGHYAWDAIPDDWPDDSNPIVYETKFPRLDSDGDVEKPAGSDNYCPSVAGYDDARFNDLLAGINNNALAIANWAQKAVNNWRDMNFTTSWPSKWMVSNFTNRSKINTDLGLVYLDMDWELDSNTSYTGGGIFATCIVSELYEATGSVDGHSIGNIGHRIHEYDLSDEPPQYYNDFPVTCSIVTKNGIRELRLTCTWGFTNDTLNGGTDNRARYVHIVGMLPLAVIDTALIS